MNVNEIKMATTLQFCRLVNRNITANRCRFSCIATNFALPSRTFATTNAVQSSSAASKHWRTERVVAVGLLALIPTGVLFPSAIFDYSLAALIPLHNHWGFSSIIVDYVPKSLQRVAEILLYALSFGTFGGLLYLSYFDVGIGNAVRMIWSV